MVRKYGCVFCFELHRRFVDSEQYKSGYGGMPTSYFDIMKNIIIIIIIKYYDYYLFIIYN